MTRLVLLAALTLALVGGPALGADEVLPSDPRIIRANSLLGDESEWPTAIELYEEVLAEQPDHVVARNWLARVHAWRGEYDQSFAYYHALLQLPDPPPDARIERAEVLSWAGKYAEAEAEFQALLARDPANERAARGLAYVYQWSGRPDAAQEAYRRALAIHAGTPDAELRKLAAELRSNLGSRFDGASQFFADSDGFRRVRVEVSAAYDLDHRTRLLASTAYTGVRSNLTAPPLPDDNDAGEFFAGLERRFGDRLRVNARLGFRHWTRSADRVVFKGETEYTVDDGLATGLQLRYDDFLDQSDSLAAVLAGLTITSGRGWAWYAFNEKLSGYAYLDVGHVSDGNERIGLGASYTYRPIGRWNVGLSWFSDFLTYAERSELYYDPVVDLTTGMSAHGQAALPRGFSLDGKIDLGFSYAREAGVSGVGVAFGVEAGPTWTHTSGYFVSLRGRYSRSQRKTAYESGGAWITLGRAL